MNNVWCFEENRPIDVICMGRVAVDLYSEQIGASLENSQSFKKYLGGCAGNIAVGTARLGLKSAMLSCVGKDAMGQFLKVELQKEKVDISLLKETSKHLTGLVLLGINPPDRFPLIFYRQQCADMQLQQQHINKNSLTQAKCLLLTGTGLSTPKMRKVTHYAVDLARSVQTKVIIDLDYRPVLWGLTERGNGELRYKTSNKVSEHYQAILPKCDLIIGTEEEFLIAGANDSLNVALANIRKLLLVPLVVKKGKEGCQVYFENVDQPLVTPGCPVEVLNVLGAGDAFMSGLLRGLLRGESWQKSTAYANACGAIVVTRHGCAPAMPNFEEMQELLQCQNF